MGYHRLQHRGLGENTGFSRGSGADLHVSREDKLQPSILVERTAGQAMLKQEPGQSLEGSGRGV